MYKCECLVQVHCTCVLFCLINFIYNSRHVKLKDYSFYCMFKLEKYQIQMHVKLNMTCTWVAQLCFSRYM